MFPFLTDVVSEKNLRDVMKPKGYGKEIFMPECNPYFESPHCIAHLKTDIREVIPYLNTALGGTAYLKKPVV